MGDEARLIERPALVYGHSARCLNCDATLSGAFCSACGQRDVAVPQLARAGRRRLRRILGLGWPARIHSSHSYSAPGTADARVFRGKAGPIHLAIATLSDDERGLLPH